MSDATEAPPADAPVAELPGDGLRESIVDDVRRNIGDALVEHLLKPQDDLWIRVRADAWTATGRALTEMGFTYFCFLSALDWKPSPFGRGEDDPTQPPPERKTAIEQGYAGGETRYQLFARVTDIARHVGVTIKADIPDDNLAIDSWHAIYAGANWHERETHEMYGIDFIGHPDLRNMYLPAEFEGFPLRKDFPLLARIVKPWPGIVDVEPMPAEDADGDGVADAPAEAPAEGADATAPAEGADAAAPADASSAEEAPEEEAADHPEVAAEPADVTEATVADAPAHPEFVAGEAPGTGESAPADDAAGSVSPQATTDVKSGDPEGESLPEAEGTPPSQQTTEAAPEPETPASEPAPGPYTGSVGSPADGSQPAGHDIKGNSQSMLFHVPGSRYYNATKPEYWFDTEENARAAGFRRPGEKAGESGD